MALRPIATSGFSTAGGGLILTPPQSFVRVGGNLVSVDGTPIASHGDDEHSNAVTTGQSSLLHINGLPVDRQGDAASCADLIANGVSWFQTE